MPWATSGLVMGFISTRLCLRYWLESDCSCFLYTETASWIGMCNSSPSTVARLCPRQEQGRAGEKARKYLTFAGIGELWAGLRPTEDFSGWRSLYASNQSWRDHKGWNPAVLCLGTVATSGLMILCACRIVPWVLGFWKASLVSLYQTGVDTLCPHVKRIPKRR